MSIEKLASLYQCNFVGKKGQQSMPVKVFFVLYKDYGSQGSQEHIEFFNENVDDAYAWASGELSQFGNVSVERKTYSATWHLSIAIDSAKILELKDWITSRDLEGYIDAPQDYFGLGFWRIEYDGNSYDLQDWDTLVLREASVKVDEYLGDLTGLDLAGISYETYVDNNYVDGIFPSGEQFSAQVFAESSPFGIDAGRVSHLKISDINGNLIYRYERGLDESTPEGDELAAMFVRALGV